jgi:hypothetical protein
VVAVAARVDGRVAITRGVVDGDQVVTSEQAGLGNGQKVR